MQLARICGVQRRALSYTPLLASIKFRQRQTDRSKPVHQREPLLPLSAFRKPRYLAEALARNAREVQVSEDDVLRFHRLRGADLARWVANYEASSLSEAIQALQTEDMQADQLRLVPSAGVPHHQLLSLPSAMRSPEEANLLLRLLASHIDETELPPSIYGQLFSESLYALSRIRQWSLLRQLLEFFLRSDHATVVRMRSSPQIWMDVAQALLKTDKIHARIVKPLYATFIRAACQNLSQRNILRRVERKAKALQQLFSRPDLLNPDLVSQILLLLKKWHGQLSPKAATDVLQMFANQNRPDLPVRWFRESVLPAFESEGIDLYDLSSNKAPNTPSLTIGEPHLVLLNGLRMDFSQAVSCFRKIVQTVENGAISTIALHAVWLTFLKIASFNVESTSRRQLEQIWQKTTAYPNLSEEERLDCHCTLMRGLIARSRYDSVIAFWDETFLSKDKPVAPNAQALVLLSTALIHSGKLDEAIAIVTWYSKKTSKFSNYTLDPSSPIPTLWPSRPPAHCAGIPDSVRLDSKVFNLLLTALFSLGEWQWFYSFYKIMQDRSIFQNADPDDISLTLYLRAANLASASSDRAGDRAYDYAMAKGVTSSSQGANMWNGKPAWQLGCEEFERVLVLAWPEFVEGEEAVEDPIERETVFAGMVTKSRQWLGGQPPPRRRSRRGQGPSIESLAGRNADHTTLPSPQSFREYIIATGLFSRAASIPLTLAWMRAISEKERTKVDEDTVLLGLALFEEGGASQREVYALNAWLIDWLGANAVARSSTVRREFWEPVKDNAE